MVLDRGGHTHQASDLSPHFGACKIWFEDVALTAFVPSSGKRDDSMCSALCGEVRCPGEGWRLLCPWYSWGLARFWARGHSRCVQGSVHEKSHREWETFCWRVKICVLVLLRGCGQRTRPWLSGPSRELGDPPPSTPRPVHRTLQLLAPAAQRGPRGTPRGCLPGG